MGTAQAVGDRRLSDRSERPSDYRSEGRSAVGRPAFSNTTLDYMVRALWQDVPMDLRRRDEE